MQIKLEDITITELIYALKRTRSERSGLPIQSIADIIKDIFLKEDIDLLIKDLKVK